MKKHEMDNKPTIIVPTNRDENFFGTFLESWKKDFPGCHLIVVEDRQKKMLVPTIRAWAEKAGFTYDVYDWTDIDKDLKENSWIIPRKTDAVRSYGFLQTIGHNPLFLVTLDDDVRPASPGHHIKEFGKKLLCGVETADAKFFSTLKYDQPRGTEFWKQTPLLVHGMWLDCLDLGGMTQLAHQITYGDEFNPGVFNEGTVPKGALFSMCSMNVAWNHTITPFMYFGLQGNLKQVPAELWIALDLNPELLNDGFLKLPVDRYGDIWTGFKVKKFLDELDEIAHTGAPCVIHSRASNVWSSIAKEKEGLNILSSQFIKNNCSYQDTAYSQDETFEYWWYWSLQAEAEKTWQELCENREDW